MHEVLTRDDTFDFGAAFGRLLPTDAIFENLTDFSNVTKVLKDYIMNKLKLYTERMQQCLYLATQKYIGDCIIFIL